MYVEEMRTSTAKATINKLKKIFSIEGSPEVLISNNAVFNSAEFQKFSQEWNFEHITSSPNYPQIKWTSRTSCRNHEAENGQM